MPPPRRQGQPAALSTSSAPTPIRVPGVVANHNVLQTVDLGPNSPAVPFAEFRALAAGRTTAYARWPTPPNRACAVQPIDIAVTIPPLGAAAFRTHYFRQVHKCTPPIPRHLSHNGPIGADGSDMSAA